MSTSKERLRFEINQSNKIAILSGAGVSTPSGVRDFRGTNGLYTENFFGLSPEKILSNRFFNTYRDMFYTYFLEYMSIPDDLKPNSIHLYTKQLADEGKLIGVVTQNIDGLYQKAGLSGDCLVEIHGNGTRWVCTKCKKETAFEDARFVEKTGNYLSSCHNFIIRPDIVLYDEQFKLSDVKRMDAMYDEADLLIVMGTRLDIVAHLDRVKSFQGKIILVNMDAVDLGVRIWDNIFIGNIESIFC